MVDYEITTMNTKKLDTGASAIIIKEIDEKRHEVRDVYVAGKNVSIQNKTIKSISILGERNSGTTWISE